MIFASVDPFESEVSGVRQAEYRGGLIMKTQCLAAKLKVVLVFSLVLAVLGCLSQPCWAQEPRGELAEVREGPVRRAERPEMFVQQMAPEHRIQEAATRAALVREEARLDLEQRAQRLERVDPRSADTARRIVEGLSKPVILPEELDNLKKEASELPDTTQVEQVRESLDAALRIADMKILVDDMSNAGQELVDRRNELTQQRAGVTGGLVVSLLGYAMTFFGFLSKQSHSKLERELMRLQIKEKRAELEAKGLDLSG